MNDGAPERVDEIALAIADEWGDTEQGRQAFLQWITENEVGQNWREAVIAKAIDDLYRQALRQSEDNRKEGAGFLAGKHWANKQPIERLKRIGTALRNAKGDDAEIELVLADLWPEFSTPEYDWLSDCDRDEFQGRLVDTIIERADLPIEVTDEKPRMPRKRF